YVVLIAPVSGLTQRGPQMLADRYSYIACIPFALLAGAGLIVVLRRVRTAGVCVAALALVGLTIQTQRQIRIWHDSKALWEHAIELDRTNAMAYMSLGSAMA